MPQVLPPIKGFIPSSLIDWPGRICSIIFLPGCNFRCPFCHAGHLVVNANALESIPFERLCEYWREHGDWIDGVTISGGEPTISDALPDLVDAIGALGLRVKLDTNGSRPDVLEALADGGRISAVSMDVKAPLDKRYDKLAGAEVDLPAIRRSIELLLGGIVPEYEFRTTVPPGLLDGDDVVDIARTLEGAEAYVIQGFQAVDCIDPEMLKRRPWRPDELKAFAERAGVHVKRCWVRGMEEVATGT